MSLQSLTFVTLLVPSSIGFSCICIEHWISSIHEKYELSFLDVVPEETYKNTG